MYRSFNLLLLLAICVELTAQKSYAAIDHVSLHVQNLDRSVVFYADLFKLDSVPDPFPQFRVTWFEMGGGVQLHLFEDKEPIPEGKYHLCFSVVHLEAFIERLKKKNIAYFDGKGKKGVLTVRSDMVRQLYLRDPDGHKIEVNDARH
jgi:lactoylglutathione lyase